MSLDLFKTSAMWTLIMAIPQSIIMSTDPWVRIVTLLAVYPLAIYALLRTDRAIKVSSSTLVIACAFTIGISLIAAKYNKKYKDAISSKSSGKLTLGVYISTIIIFFFAFMTASVVGGPPSMNNHSSAVGLASH